jgi:ornithine carbamoyltransferase
MGLISISDLSAQEIRSLWASASAPSAPVTGTVGWSFEGNGIRTRTTFIQAFRDLGMNYTELPQLLKSEERACDLAGYLDPFYDIYVIRESNHQRLKDFAQVSRRPVINAMSSEAHPCEVLSDAYFVQSRGNPLETMRIGLWGPPTNVLNSWHELAVVLGLSLHHFCPRQFHHHGSHVVFSDTPDATVDLLITDSWPKGFSDKAWSLSREQLTRLGNPRILPTPPFTIGNELAFDPAASPGFLGYEQKRSLLEVQRALLAKFAGKPAT